jgi:hypothetical protein
MVAQRHKDGSQRYRYDRRPKTAVRQRALEEPFEGNAMQCNSALPCVVTLRCIAQRSTVTRRARRALGLS